MQKGLSTRSIDFFINRFNGATQSPTGFLDIRRLVSFAPEFFHTPFIKLLFPAQSVRASWPHQPATDYAVLWHDCAY